MAVTELALLRRLVDEPDESTYTDVELTDRLNAAGGDKNVVAAAVWQEKVVKYSTMVDISEGGSTRRNSQAYDHARDMLAYFQEQVSAAGSTVIRRIVRA